MLLNSTGATNYNILATLIVQKFPSELDYAKSINVLEKPLAL